VHPLHRIPRIHYELRLLYDVLDIKTGVVGREDHAVHIGYELVGEFDAHPLVPSLVHHFGNEGVVIDDFRAFLGYLLHDEEGRTLAGIVDIRLVGHAQEEDG